MAWFGELEGTSSAVEAEDLQVVRKWAQLVSFCAACSIDWEAVEEVGFIKAPNDPYVLHIWNDAQPAVVDDDPTIPVVEDLVTIVNEIYEMNAEGAIAAIQQLSTLDELTALHEAEVNGKNRVTVLRAINDRLDELAKDSAFGLD